MVFPSFPVGLLFSLSSGLMVGVALGLGLVALGGLVPALAYPVSFLRGLSLEETW